jgi:DNA-directed RNA polymerase subunit alpha
MIQPAFYTKQEVKEDGSHVVFTFEPLSVSFGHTLGNALRRTLLSSLPGAAVTAVKFAGVPHLFTTIPGVKESVLDFVMNLKNVRFKQPTEGRYTISLVARGLGKIYAKDLEGDVEVVNKDLYLGEITSEKGKVDLEAVVEVGYGYSASEERESTETGFIPVDASFSPVKLVNYTVEDARVGRKSNYERLIVEVITDGSVTPVDAVKQAVAIISSQVAHILSGNDVAPSSSQVSSPPRVSADNTSKVLETIIDELNLPSRVINALLREKIETVADLLKRGKADLVGLKGVGRKSIDLIDEELKKMGVELT